VRAEEVLVDLVVVVDGWRSLKLFGDSADRLISQYWRWTSGRSDMQNLDGRSKQ
jgi:hypothetical protein